MGRHRRSSDQRVNEEPRSQVLCDQDGSVLDRRGRGEGTFGPIVIWIAVRPKTTSAGAVQDDTPDIFDILSSSTA